MALFNKIFFSSSSSSSNKKKNFNSNQSQQYLSKFPFESSQVRVLLYRECDIRGRRLLFDSSAIQKINLKGNANPDIIRSTTQCSHKKDQFSTTKNSNGFIQISNGFGYKHSRPDNTADISNIGEMIFGALAMSFRGTSLKVHWLETPARVVCSQVFLSPVHSNDQLLNPSINSLASGTNGQMDQSYTTIDSTSTSLNSFSIPFSVCINSNLDFMNKIDVTNPLDVPISENGCNENSRLYHTYSTGDSGYCGGPDRWTASNSSYCQYSTRSSLGSVFSIDHESFRKLSIDDSSSLIGDCSILSSDGSLRRRISRNISTSLENKNSLSDFIGFIGDNYQTATNGGSDSCVTRYPQRRHSDVNESRSNPEITRRRGASGDTINKHGGHNRYGGKRARLGLAVCITMSENYEKEMEEFCCEHIALLESMLCRLRASAEKAYINHKNFLQIMLNAWQSTTQWINDLFTAPRLICPVWLTLSNETCKDPKNLADIFIRELCWLLSFADTKDTNFFISTMLTAILTHHLGWVSTVAAINSKGNFRNTDALNEHKVKLTEISRKHPYNALWAQMGDLYGAVGFPPKIARTIICGNEKRKIQKVLNVLTYFIRCGEIKKCAKAKVFDKSSINLILTSSDTTTSTKLNKSQPKSGMTRSQTFRQYLNSVKIDDDDINDEKAISNHNSIGNFTKNVMNDIPNVLAFRDSRFIQQELRIGNYLMDTGIEMNPRPISLDLQDNKIQLIVTTPDNVEVKVENEYLNSTAATETIEMDSNKNLEYLWQPIQEEGILYNNLKKNQYGDKIMNYKENDRHNDNNVKYLKRSNSLYTNLEKVECKKMTNVNYVENDNLKSHTSSLSDLITANSVGKSERFTWGIERMKDVISPEEEKHFEINKKIVEKEVESRKDNGVVFVLGDNEALVNIKRSNDDIPKLDSNSMERIQLEPRRMCNHHKKHSGVKFNFEQYPQIATNYMKSKNLDLSNYDFLEKSQKVERILSYESTTCAFPISVTKTEDSSSSECEYCTGAGARVLQTPSNATELEFEIDDNYSTNNGKASSSSKICDNKIALSKIQAINSQSNDFKLNRRNNKNDLNNGINIIYLPLPGIEESENIDNNNKMKSGFIPSLLVGISDHYIPDMVLQGTIASPQTWEMNLKQDLALSAHCASVMPTPTENIAVVANLDKWDVKVVSSQTYAFPYVNETNGPVGMSQLVSSMLETVHAMSTSGISAFECISYIESKLQEMYLQSESLAAFLLATEFCSLNTVTSALNLSANDVPLLLSVASIHSPEVTCKYGVSFR